MTTVYVSIGNSDNGLTQAEWSVFADDFRRVMHRSARQVHGEWYSLPNAEWQNACIAAAIPQPMIDPLRADLTAMRQHYGQDSVAWAEVPETEFI